MATTINVIRYPGKNGGVNVVRTREDKNGKVYYERFNAMGAGRYIRISREKMIELISE